MAQKTIRLDEVMHHVGDTVTVKGKIFSSKYLETAKGTPSFINVGGLFPNQLLTIVIFGEARNKLGFDPTDKKYNGGMAVVTGKIELYKGKPQIVVNDRSQLQILFDEEVDASKIPAIDQR